MLSSARRLTPPDHTSSHRSPSRKRSNSFGGSMGAGHFPVSEASPRTATHAPGHRRTTSGSHGSARHPELSSPMTVVVPANIATADPRTPIHGSSSAHRVHFAEPRPAPLRRSTWSPPSHVTSFVPNLKIHRTIAYSHQQPAVVYDVLFKPNHMNIMNAASLSPIAAHTLNLPATLPRVTELTLTCRDLIWPVFVTSTTNPLHAITNLDVIEAVYATLRVPVSRREWDSLGHNSKAQARVADAYNKRCVQTRDWDNGVRRCDWLQGRTILLGIESKANGSHELVFGK